MDVINFDVKFYKRKKGWNLNHEICEALDFTHQVLEVWRRPISSTCHKYLDYHYFSKLDYPVHMFHEIDSFNIPNLLHTIQIRLRERANSKSDYYLVHNQKYESNNKKEDIESECIQSNNKRKGIVDPLGAYFSDDNHPYIELYISRIEKAAHHYADPNTFRWLFSKVLIHELVHASMDLHNWTHFEKNGIEKIKYSTIFGKWREESMANAMTLQIIKNFKDVNFYNFAKTFMLSQPSEYALGVLMEDMNYSFYRYVESKKSGIHKKLQSEWLKYVKGSPDTKGLEKWNDILTSSKVLKYNSQYYAYSDNKDLFLLILQDYIASYMQKNNKLPSYADLSNKFPIISTIGYDENKVASLKKVKNKETYRTDSKDIIHLSDGDYSIYIAWNTDDVKSFLASAKKVGYKIEYFENN